MLFDKHYRKPRSSTFERVEPPQADPSSPLLKEGNVDVEKFNARLAALFNHWVNSARRELPLGQMMESQLGSCTCSRSNVAILADTAPYLEKSLSRIDLDNAHGREFTHTLLQFAYGCGAEACAQWIADTYKCEIDETEMISLIAGSGNFEWLKQVLIGKGYSELPDCVFGHAKRSQLEEVADDIGFPAPQSLLK